MFKKLFKTIENVSTLVTILKHVSLQVLDLIEEVKELRYEVQQLKQNKNEKKT